MKKETFSAILFILLVPTLLLAAPYETLRKALVHIALVQDESGAWSRLRGEYPPDAEVTSWAVKVLAMNNVASEKVNKGIEFILKDQGADGSWNNNTTHVASAIMALRQVNKGEEAMQRALQYLRDVQEGEGGFKRLGKEGVPLALCTAVVLVALKEAGVPSNDPMVRRAVDWLMGSQNADGGYGMPRGSPSFALSTAWTIKALTAYHVSPSTPFVQDALDWLVKLQKPGGGFSPAPGSPEDPEVTAHVIIALKNIPDKKAIIARAADFLAKTQQQDGTFISASPIQFNRAAKKNTQTACFAAWALSEILEKSEEKLP